MKIKLNDNISTYRLIRRIMQPLYILRMLIRNRRARDIISALLLALSLALLGMTLFQRVDGAASAEMAATTTTIEDAMTTAEDVGMEAGGLAGASSSVTDRVSADASSSSAEAAAVSDTASRAATQSEPLSIFGFKPVVIMSGSMEPALKTGALAIVRRTKDVKPGDMIMFRHGGTWVIHRYIADGPEDTQSTDESIGSGTIITKGDNNAEPDLMPVSRDSIYGKVVARANWLAPVFGKLQGMRPAMPMLHAHANPLAFMFGRLQGFLSALCIPEPAYALPLESQAGYASNMAAYTAEIGINQRNQFTYITSESTSFDSLTPGDSWSYSVTTTNRTAQPVTYALTGATSEIVDTLLFEKLELTISDPMGSVPSGSEPAKSVPAASSGASGSNGPASQDLLYTGPLSAAAFAPITLAPGGSKTLVYTFTFPADAGNEYQNRAVRAKFCYYAEAAADTTTPSKDAETPISSGSQDPVEDVSHKKPDDPKRHKTAEWTADHRRGSGDGSGSGSDSGPVLISDTPVLVGGPGAGSIYLYSSPDVENPVLTDGEWILVDAERHIWNYRVGAELVKGGWIAVRNPYSQTDAAGHHWFYFYEDGQMAYGWLKLDAEPQGRADDADTFEWYFLHEVSDGDLGTLVTGWHEDRDDGRTYYLDSASGEMVHGWHTIDGSDYYFAEQSEIAGLNWLLRKSEELDKTHIFGWFFRNFHRRTYGSMYRDEQTPDGSYVGKDGKRMPSDPASVRSMQSGGAS